MESRATHCTQKSRSREVPLLWSKTAGGDLVSWVGFELIHSSHKLGISQRTAEWFGKWTDEISKARTVNTTSFEEGLERVMCVAGALEHERPFLSPFYKSMSLQPRGSVRAVPPCLRFFLSCLSWQLQAVRLRRRYVNLGLDSQSRCSSFSRTYRNRRWIRHADEA